LNSLASSPLPDQADAWHASTKNWPAAFWASASANPDAGAWIDSVRADHYSRVQFASGVWIVRDVIGNPFHNVTLNPAYLSWGDATIPHLAKFIYDEYRFEELPILADALEEAGCANGEILEHCRLPGPHVRGCWIIDLASCKAIEDGMAHD
jgi:hypothetical protein